MSGIPKPGSGSPAASAGLWHSVSTFVRRHRGAAYAIGAVAVFATAGGIYHVKQQKTARKGISSRKSEKQTSEKQKTEEEPESGKTEGDEQEDERVEDSSKGSDVTAGSAAAAAAAAKKKKKNKKKLKNKKSGDSTAEKIATEESVKSMSKEERAKLATELKTLGNKAYGQKEYPNAIDFYSQAITCSHDPIFFSNRAACYSAIGDFEQVVKDTTEALKLDPTYVKALNRRSSAYEQLEKLDDALMDSTVSCVFDGFANESMTATVERLLKKVAEKKAVALMAGRPPKLPAASFIQTYLDSFRPQSKPDFNEEYEGDRILSSAYDALDNGDYQLAYDQAKKAATVACSSAPISARAYNLIGTFKFVSGDSKGSMEEFNEAINLDSSFIQPYVRLSAAYLDENDHDSMWNIMQKAESVNDKDSDLYYHRAQVHFVSGEFAEAIADYNKSIALDDSFIYSYIQLGVAQYKIQALNQSMKTFEDCKKKFPGCSEVYNYFGEILLDQQKFAEAVENFDRAISIEKRERLTIMSAMPLINKALAVFQWKKDIKQAESLCRQALSADPDCDIAIASMAQFLLQQGKAQEALSYFEQSAQLARTEAEMVNAFSYAEATRTQIALTEKYPQLVGRLSQSM
ncbi:mitochondrial TOM complex TPR repeat subunit Tom70 [Schizosaccharomyces osmophilus]|uniref:Mitochondrial TOM complex TPR repeat subunit Tom70 n=1 Tax=Schizosaccharomyces osmophilus TaxID=2545709 RepID=A0AAE9WCU1_9SCHI|nr:mitochondrial TOM complex TPR repeat subunit Tom70 [Schizosaccharomyces osmophilus]WBW73498.1 mitochondrial TOM complex TPR repeat subunit Tom70 [Schizosaccharomyces osmophilus]